MVATLGQLRKGCLFHVVAEYTSYPAGQAMPKCDCGFSQERYFFELLCSVGNLRGALGFLFCCLALTFAPGRHLRTVEHCQG